MFRTELNFFIVGNKHEIAELLMEQVPIEKCTYNIKVVDELEEICEKGSAIIYDIGDDVNSVSLHRVDVKQIVVVSTWDVMNLSNRVLSFADNMWILQDGHEKDIVAIQFQNLATAMRADAKAENTEICFHTLIDSVPDLIWFKDTDGRHLIVNNSFCKIVGKNRHQIYGKGHMEIWDSNKEDEEVCLLSDGKIMECRGTQSFEESLYTKSRVLLLKSYKSALLNSHGEVFGTCGIAHDITALNNLGAEMDLIFNSIPFIAIMEDVMGNVLNKNNMFDRYFPEFINIKGKSSNVWRKSLNRRFLSDEDLREVVTVKDIEGKEHTFVFDEEAIMDSAQRIVGAIITLIDISFERDAFERKEEEINTDFLTGIGNKRCLIKRLKELKGSEDVVIVFADMDYFKQVNDTYGHDAGDEALRLMAMAVEDCFPECEYFRFGGDEFVIVGLNKSKQFIKKCAEKLMTEVKGFGKHGVEFSKLGTSMGIAFYVDTPDSNLSTLMNLADGELYKAKENGRGQYSVYKKEK